MNLLNFIKQNGVTDLIFINNVFAANTSVQIQWIQGLMYQHYVPPAPQVEESVPEGETTEPLEEQEEEFEEEEQENSRHRDEDDD